MMVKKELKHKLELIEIHKEIRDIHQKTIQEMGALTPPFIRLEFKERREEIKKLMIEFKELLKHLDLIIEPKILGRIETLLAGDLEGNDIFLGILIFKSLLGLKSEAAEQQFLKSNLGGTIIIQNSKNVIINSTIDHESQLSVGDNTKE